MLGQQVEITDEMIVAAATALNSEFGAELNESVYLDPARVAAEMALKAALSVHVQRELPPSA